MKILIVLAHPEIQSMNGALYNKAIQTLKAEGHEVKVSDLFSLNNSSKRSMLQKQAVLQKK